MLTSQTSRKERVQAVNSTFVLRRTEDSRQKQPDPRLAVILAESYEKHLTNLGIHPNDYDKIYELAVLLYNSKEVKGPFGIDEVLQGARKFLEKKTPIVKLVKEKKEKVLCGKCNGTGLKFVKGRISYDENKKAIKCEECE